MWCMTNCEVSQKQGLTLFRDFLPDEPQDVPVAQDELRVEGHVEDVLVSSEYDSEGKDNDKSDDSNDDESYSLEDSFEDDGDEDTVDFVFVKHIARVIPQRKVTNIV